MSQVSVWNYTVEERTLFYLPSGHPAPLGILGCPSSGFLPPHPPLLFLFEEHNPIKNSFSMPRNIESSSLCYVVVAVVWWISCVWLLRPHEL